MSTYYETFFFSLRSVKYSDNLAQFLQQILYFYLVLVQFQCIILTDLVKFRSFFFQLRLRTHSAFHCFFCELRCRWLLFQTIETLLQLCELVLFELRLKSLAFLIPRVVLLFQLLDECLAVV